MGWKDTLVHRLALPAGPALALLMMAFEPPGQLGEPAWLTAACMVWMALWWMTEALPVAVTALLPILLFPLLDIADLKTTTSAYAHPTVYLFMGGFLLALAIEKWGLHRRLALAVLLSVGSNARALTAGFMLTAAALSMWISNTATTIMLLPIGIAVIKVVSDTVSDIADAQRRNFRTALMLGIAYAATIGGVATLIGTPPNTFMAGFLSDTYGIEVSFASWLAVGLPLTLVMLPLAWWLLVGIVFPFNFKTSRQTHSTLMQLRQTLGVMGREEKTIAAVFALAALAWILRPALDNWLPGLSDTGIAMTAGLSMFLLPASPQDRADTPKITGAAPESPTPARLLSWTDSARLPWGILVLFGGGLALAGAVSNTGLAVAIGSAVAGLQGVEILLLTALIVTVVIFLTELTSNLATAATFLPVVGAVALDFGIDPLVFVAPVALAASCAFMLPVATPPNAIVFGSGYLRIPQMARAGLGLNIASIVLVSLVSIALVPVALLAAG